ncbi:hypothetical protein C0991_008159 [Blastosporella zonata]|nr:hypothetical protein C0991_008159 [Blastosporella zonata]
MFLSASFVVLSLLSGSYAVTIGPKSNMYIVNADIAPDGFTRSAVLASGSSTNGSFPGPLITANKGDHFQINVIDQLTDTTMLTSTSIHWHGFFQTGTAYADGPVGVNQCPISPGNSFLYDFTVPNQAGTFWYHSHLSTQYCDGLRGAIVVYDPNDPYKNMYDVDDETTVITLADWYHVPAPSAGLVPTPAATLINGLGRAVGGDATPFSIVNVIHGKRYRFRVVSVSCDPNYIFSIDGHNFTVIEVDGVNHQPLAIDSLQIYAGQRYSLVLTANQPVGNYWIRAQSSAGPTTFDGGLNSAVLRYQGALAVDPVTNSTLSNLLKETSLSPLVNPGAPGGSGPADVSLYLDIAFANAQFTINGATFIPPTTPVLLQIISGARLATDLLPSGSVYVLPPNKVIEVIIPGGTVGAPVSHNSHLIPLGSSLREYDSIPSICTE